MREEKTMARTVERPLHRNVLNKQDKHCNIKVALQLFYNIDQYRLLTLHYSTKLTDWTRTGVLFWNVLKNFLGKFGWRGIWMLIHQGTQIKYCVVRIAHSAI